MSQWAAIADLADAVRGGETTALQLVETALKIIEQHKDFNAVIVTTADRALSRARELDLKVAAGASLGRLVGVPFIAKDNFLVFGAETTAASNILRGFTAPYQATAVERLEAEGAICVAKANLDAFAHGTSTENSDFMITKNPHDQTKVPGGSSGGSAAAVVLDMVPFAIGTDTGGSIRNPASFCGAVGFKPTYGLVSRSGVVAMASSLDVIGPLTKTVADASLVLACMAGVDELDSTTIAADERDYQIAGKPIDLTGVKIGIIKEHMNDGLDLNVRTRVEQAIETLRSAGAAISEVSIPSIDAALAVYYILCPAEVSSNLSRYDGQRYGYSSPDSTDLVSSYNKSRSTGFGKEAKRRIIIGTYVLSSGYYDAYYKKAQTVRTKLITEFEACFSNVDYLIGPAMPMTAFDIGSHTKDPLQMYLTDILTVAANLVGVPAISLPIKVSDGEMPIGLQLMAAQRADYDLLEVSRAVEDLIS